MDDTQNSIDTQSLQDQIRELQDALERAHDTAFGSGAALKVDDLSRLAAKYLTLDSTLPTKQVMVAEYIEEGPGTMPSYEHGKIMESPNSATLKYAKAYFYCVQVRKDRVEDGVKAIAATINELNSKGAIVSYLATMSAVDLAVVCGRAPTSAVFCFVHVKEEFTEMAANMPHRILDGGVGMELHDCSIELNPGEFIVDVRLAHNLVMIAPNRTVEARLHDVIVEHLRVLPPGTEFLGYRACAVQDLSMPYELKFRNPLLQNIRQVHLEFTRQVAIIDESLKQFNLLTGIYYLRQNPLDSSGKCEWFPKAP